MLQYLYLQKPVTLVIVICMLSLLPWIGVMNLSPSEKTEEVQTAISILETGEWTLPGTSMQGTTHNAPMLPWLIAAISLPQGYVSALTARLPSILAFMALVGVLLVFYGQRIKFQEAFISVLLLISCFGMHKAAITIHPDMLFAAFVIIGLTELFRWEEKLELKGLPITIPILLGCAVLTKGISGFILPAVIFCIYLLIQQKYKLRTLCKIVAYITLSTSFLPILWYIAAWKEGGDAFASTALAQNLGYLFTDRFNEFGIIAGKDLYTLLLGLLPWALFVFLSLFGLRSRRKNSQATQAHATGIGNRLRSMEPVKMFSLLAVTCSILFSIFSQANQGAYQATAFPFLSLFLAQYVLYQKEYQPVIMRIFAAFIATITLSVIMLFILNSVGVFNADSTISNSIQSACAAGMLSKANTLFNLSDTTVMASLFIFILTGSILFYQMSKKIQLKILYAIIAVTIAMYVLLDCAIIYNTPVENMETHIHVVLK